MAKTKEQIIQDIESGATTLGIEYGSTRIKAVLDDADNNPIAIGTFDWENTFDGTYWTYAEEELVSGIQAAYASLKADVAEKIHHRRFAVFSVYVLRIINIHTRKFQIIKPFLDLHLRCSVIACVPNTADATDCADDDTQHEG
jgi:hypothetical protein